MQIMPVRPAHPQSYERLFHLTNVPGLILPLRSGASDEIHKKLMKPLLERAIGVIYRPESELASHYFEAILPRQFDEYIWIDRTTGDQAAARHGTGRDARDLSIWALVVLASASRSLR